MNISEFTGRLHDALTVKGLSEEEISDCITGIVPSIQSSFEDPDDATFNAVVTQCVEIIENKRKASTPPAEEEIVVPSFGDDVPASTTITFCGDSDGIVPSPVHNDGNSGESATVPVVATADDGASPVDDTSVSASGDTVTIPSIRSFTAESAVHKTPVTATATPDITSASTVTIPVVSHAVPAVPKTETPAPIATENPVVEVATDSTSTTDVPSEAPPVKVKKEKPGPVPAIKLSPKGTAAFIGLTVITSPLWGLFFLVFFLPFIILFILESAVIAALIAGVAAISAAGTAASLTGIVYGAIRSFSVFSEGLYEIGFGVIVAGVTMIVGILLFNGAVRFMPWLFKKTAVFAKFLTRKAVSIFRIFKRRFEKL